MYIEDQMLIIIMLEMFHSRFSCIYVVVEKSVGKYATIFRNLLVKGLCVSVLFYGTVYTRE